MGISAKVGAIMEPSPKEPAHEVDHPAVLHPRRLDQYRHPGRKPARPADNRQHPVRRQRRLRQGQNRVRAGATLCQQPAKATEPARL